MRKVWVILRKEFREIRQQRILLFSILLPPLLFVVLPLFYLQLGGNGSKASTLHVPSLQGLTLHEYTQGLVGTIFSNIFILLSMIVPSTIAAYSIIGEKNSHTLEPLLATPVRRWQLLAGKMLAALLPGGAGHLDQWRPVHRGIRDRDRCECRLPRGHRGLAHSLSRRHAALRADRGVRHDSHFLTSQRYAHGAAAFGLGGGAHRGDHPGRTLRPV